MSSKCFCSVIISTLSLSACFSLWDSLPYLQRGGSQQRSEYTVISNLFTASVSISKFKFIRLLIIVVVLLLLMGVAYFRLFCSTRIAPTCGTFPFVAATVTISPRVFSAMFAVISRGTVFIATAATSTTISVTISSSPSVAIIRAAAAIAANRVVLLRFCIESQA